MHYKLLILIKKIKKIYVLQLLIKTNNIKLFSKLT